MKQICVLVSGGGTNLQALMDAEKSGIIKNGKITCVISSKEGAYALERAKNAGIGTVVIPRKEYADSKSYSEAILAELNRQGADLVVLAGFMVILDECVTKAYPYRIINVHPALIPSFCGEGFYGLKVHEKALEYGVKVSGATIHFVNEKADAGAIILQGAVDVANDETPESLQKKIMENVEWKLLPKAVSLFCEDRISIMGRSVNSRNRVFTETEDGIKTEAADPSKLSDPHLIIYSPVRVLGNKTIVTNGDQTDTIYELMDKQQTFEQSLRTREYEDDAPNYTPRISGIMHVENGAYNYAMSILKSADGNPDCCERFTYTYTDPLNGVGHFIHTYMGDGNPLPSFEGEPKKVEIPNDIEEFTGKLWEALNEDNKVSLFVRYIDIASGKAVSKIVNKYSK